MYKLIIQDDEGKTTVVPLIREELTIGRQEGNTIRLTERNVSRRHAKLHRAQETILIEDLDSYNGVRVNGSRIQGKVEIKEADRVQIGDYLIEVKADLPNSQNATEKLSILPDIAAAPVPVETSSSGAATARHSASQIAQKNGVASHSGDLGEEAEKAAAAPAPAQQGHARLVVLSTNLAGRDFDLDKPAMVIGRTEENDVCINHRSISRHHAKVIYDGDTYSIVDLQSANGVRVNGEDYGKVELRRGDTVDLGHVRLRFVAPGEDFVFGRDAQAVDISSEGSNKAIWVALAVLAAAGLVIFLLTSGSGSKADDNNDKRALELIDAGTPTAVKDPIDPDPPVTAADAAPANPGVDTAALEGLLQQARDAETREDWRAMSKAASAAIELDPTNNEAQALAQKATFEAANLGAYQTFQKAVRARQWQQVADSFAALPADSVYRAKGQPEHERLKGEYRRYQLQVAEKAARRGKCNDLRRQASQVPAPWADVAREIRELDCQTETRPDVRPDPDPDPDPPEDDGATYDELLEQANSAVKDTQYGKGLKLCREAIAKNPSDQRALIPCVIASCNLKQAATAKKYFKRINSQTRKDGLRQICVRLGVPGFAEEE